MIHSHPQPRLYLHVCRLLAGLLLASWLAPAVRGDGWSCWPFNRDKPGKPDKIVTLWSDTVLTQAGRPPVRGFGGRLMFYEGKKEDPVKVEGTLVVYAFDETNREANNAKPDRKYVFTPLQLPLHYSKSKVGHSYSVWLPWDEVGGEQKEITLIVRFQPSEGETAVSEPCRQLLPGRVAPDRAQSAAGGVFVPGAVGQHACPVGVGQAGFVPPAAGNCGNVAVGSPMPAGVVPSVAVVGAPMNGGGVQPVAYQAPVMEGPGSPPDQLQQRRITTTTISVPSGTSIRSAITWSQGSPATGDYRPAPGPAGPAPAPWPNYAAQNYGAQHYASQSYPAQSHPAQSYPAQNYPLRNYPAQSYPPQNSPAQNYPPQNSAPAGSVPVTGYAPPAATSAASPGLQLRSGFAPYRQWPLGEPLARLSHDRAPSQPHPAEPPFGPASPPAQAAANAAPAAPSGAPQWPN